jgi:hypothetical protein
MAAEVNMNDKVRMAAAVAAICASFSAQAGKLSVAECFEGSDFIANAAHARENGMSRADFLSRMEDDFELIQAYPPQLRWFAKDEDDERFLLESAKRVFDAPQAPERHRALFLAACFERQMV